MVFDCSALSVFTPLSPAIPYGMPLPPDCKERNFLNFWRTCSLRTTRVALSDNKRQTVSKPNQVFKRQVYRVLSGVTAKHAILACIEDASADLRKGGSCSYSCRNAPASGFMLRVLRPAL